MPTMDCATADSQPTPSVWHRAIPAAGASQGSSISPLPKPGRNQRRRDAAVAGKGRPAGPPRHRGGQTRVTRQRAAGARLVQLLQGQRDPGGMPQRARQRIVCGRRGVGIGTHQEVDNAASFLPRSARGRVGAAGGVGRLDDGDLGGQCGGQRLVVRVKEVGSRKVAACRSCSGGWSALGLLSGRASALSYDSERGQAVRLRTSFGQSASSRRSQVA